MDDTHEVVGRLEIRDNSGRRLDILDVRYRTYATDAEHAIERCVVAYTRAYDAGYVKWVGLRPHVYGVA